MERKVWLVKQQRVVEKQGEDKMAALVLGIVCLLLAFLLPMPQVLYLILLIVGIVALLYGLYVLFVGRGPRDGTRRVRWY